MKIIENITLYKCEYCAKKYQRKHFCERHENMCSNNPKNFMKCMNCRFVEKRTMYYNKWIPCLIHGEQESDATIKAFWCIKKEHWIYPPTKVSNPIPQEDIEYGIPNEPMPCECDFHDVKMF